MPSMLIAAPYLLGAWLLTVWVSDGGPGWLNLLVLLFIWNASGALAERESAAHAAGGDLHVLTATRI